MNVGFTGHRDRKFDEAALRKIVETPHPDVVWIHGGAQGFDSLVEEVAASLGIKTTIIRPDYAKYGRGAPLVRDREIVDQADFMIAGYDGRTHGGTYYTIQYAKRQKKQVIEIHPKPLGQ